VRGIDGGEPLRWSQSTRGNRHEDSLETYAAERFQRQGQSHDTWVGFCELPTR
jgi:hypothetical protein